MAICVLSPISQRKKPISVVRKAPRRGGAAASSASRSGTRVQIAMAMKERPSPQRSSAGESRSPTHSPATAATAWFASVAMKMPAMIGTGRRNCEASTRARSCVRSPISAMATTVSEVKNASTGDHGAGRRMDQWRRHPPPGPGDRRRCQRSRQARARCPLCRPRHGPPQGGPSLLTRAPLAEGRLLPNDHRKIIATRRRRQDRNVPERGGRRRRRALLPPGRGRCRQFLPKVAGGWCHKPLISRHFPLGIGLA